MDLEIIDNFLSDKKFNLIKSSLLCEYMPWYFNDYLVYKNDGLYQFTHTFYGKKLGGIVSDYFSIFDECIAKLKINELLRIKANLNPKTVFHRNTGYHIDIPNVKTAVYYINTNNGGTKFKNGKFVKSISNRIVLFDSNLQHAGITCTDEKRRVVINFNYL
jgi:hypothetical protein